jgi:cytochrome subunit of sulfide dehydrogenase
MFVRSSFAGALMALAISAFASGAEAQQLQPQDVAVLAGPCANCHGTDGRTKGPIPSIAGRPAATIQAMLKAYKSDTPPPGTTIMNRLVKGYSDEQIEALAKYFAAIKAEGAR